MAREASGKITTMSPVDRARREGYTEGEIKEYLAPRIKEAQAAGWSEQEISDFLGIKPIDHGEANRALAERMHDEITKAQEGGQKKSALERMGQTVKDVSTVYAPIEAGINLATGFAGGFPAYLAGGLFGLAQRHTVNPDLDPKQVAEKWAETMTYEPYTEAGKRLAGTVSSPLVALTEMAETSGHKVADVTGSPVAAAITEGTIAMLPAFIIPALSRRTKGKLPDNSDIHLTAKDLGREPLETPLSVAELEAMVKKHQENTKTLEPKIQETYEKTGIDPQTLHEQARVEPTVKADLASDNRIPFAKEKPEPTPGKAPPPKEPSGKAEPGTGSFEAAEKAVLEHIRLGESEHTARSLDNFYTAVKDDIYPIAKIENALAKGVELNIAESPYGLARLTRGAAGKALQFLEHGTFNFKTFKTTGPSLKQILKPFGKDLNQFRAYIVAKRVIELEGRGIETGFLLKDAQLVVKNGSKKMDTAAKQLVEFQNSTVQYLRDAGLITAEDFAALVELNKDYVPFNRLFEGEATGGGAGKGLKTRNPMRKIKGSDRPVLDPLETIIKNTYTYLALAERNAVGLKFGNLVKADPVLAEALGVKVVKQPIKAIKLQEKEIQRLFDEFLTVREQTTKKRTEKTTTTAGEEVAPGGKIFETNKKRVKEALEARGFTANEAEIMMKRLNKAAAKGDDVSTLVQEVVRTEQVVGTDIRLGSSAATVFRADALRPGPNQVRYFENGKAVVLDVPPELAKAFSAVDQQSASMLVKILAVPAKTLRAGAILTPDFMIRNVARDQLSAFVFSKTGYIPLYDMMRGAFSIAKKDTAFQNWLKSGGPNSALVAMDRQYLKQHLKDLNKQTGIMRRSWNVVNTPLEVLRITSELLENATRLGEFKRHGAMTKAEIQKAGFASREVTLDFQRIGAQTRGLNMISAFMNAGLEGLDRTARAFKDRPMATTAKVGAGITMPSVLLWYANNSTPERTARYQQIPGWQRDLFWIVMTDDHIYRIPKPFELGVIFGSSAERMLDKFAIDKPEAMKDFMTSIGSAVVPNVLPTFAVPPAEQLTNHSVFKGSPLIPSRLEGILPEYQYNEYTTELSRAVGKLVGAFPGLKEKSIASPIVIDNYIRGWTGGLGVYTTQMLDAGLRKAGVLPDPPKPFQELQDLPVIRAFTIRYPTASAASVQDFYDTYTSRSTFYKTFTHLAKRGEIEGATDIVNENTESFIRLEGIADSLATINSIIWLTHRNPEMDPSDKRQLIDSMYGQMIDLTKAGNEIMRDTEHLLTTDVTGDQ